MLQRFQNKALVLVALGCACIGSQAAQAAAVSATASITDVTTSLLTLSNDQYLNDASTPLHSGFSTGTVLQDYNFTDSAPNGNLSFASIDPTFAPAPGTSAGAIGSGSGSATVLWSFDWQATGTGTASIDLGYLFSATVQNLLAGETGIASSDITLLLDGTSLKSEALNFFNNVNGNTSGLSDLLLTFGVSEGQTGSFTVTAASNALVAPVPLPAGIWLFGSALLGLTRVLRRRSPV
jgi:hypothetical protein